MANNVIIPVTARKIGPEPKDLSKPKVFYLPEQDIKKLEPRAGNKGAAVFLNFRKEKKIETYESIVDIKTGQAEGSTANPYTKNNFQTVAAAGSVLTTATDVTRYLVNISAATADSADGIQLPPPSDRNVVVAINSATAPVEVFPNSASAFIDAGASGASKTIPVGRRMHFATEPTTTAGASAVWKTATDDGE